MMGLVVGNLEMHKEKKYSNCTVYKISYYIFALIYIIIASDLVWRMQLMIMVKG